MQLAPRYDTDPVMVLDGAPADIAVPTVRQRRRLAAVLSSFDDDQWAHPSRCDGWSARDVVVHLDSTNMFWTASIDAGLRGEPTRYLSRFDPVASPAQLVAETDDLGAEEVLDRFLRSNDALVDLLTALDGDDWSVPAESPPGHVAIGTVAHHALWDSWVHERDILVPQGIPADREDDEIAACLRYVAGLGPTLAINRETSGTGIMSIAATHPDVDILVEIGDRVAVRSGTAEADLRLSGDAVELLEALSIRGPLRRVIPPATSWMLRGLSETFDSESPDETRST